MNEFQVFVCFATFLLTSLSLISDYLTQRFPRFSSAGCHHLLDQALPSILTAWPSLPSCKYSLMLFNKYLALNFSLKILSASLILHLHITLLTSFLSSLVISSSLTIICIKYICNFTAWNESPGTHQRKCSINWTKWLYFHINQTSVLFSKENT